MRVEGVGRRRTLKNDPGLNGGLKIRTVFNRTEKQMRPMLRLNALYLVLSRAQHSKALPSPPRGARVTAACPAPGLEPGGSDRPGGGASPAEGAGR